MKLYVITLIILISSRYSSGNGHADSILKLLKGMSVYARFWYITRRQFLWVGSGEEAGVCQQQAACIMFLVVLGFSFFPSVKLLQLVSALNAIHNISNVVGVVLV